MPNSSPRRQPETGDRVRDAARTKAKLLDAALTEFAARGFDGARVSEIADRAGVNKQLISYYFGGKEGLYRALQRSWLEAERETETLPVGEVMRWYLHQALSDPRGTRLALWHGLSEDPPQAEEQQDTDREQRQLRQRQADGEIDPDLDLAALQLAWTGMVMAPMAFPDLTRRLFGVAPDSAEFEERYGQALSRVLARLVPTQDSDPKGSTS